MEWQQRGAESAVYVTGFFDAVTGSVITAVSNSINSSSSSRAVGVNGSPV